MAAFGPRASIYFIPASGLVLNCSALWSSWNSLCVLVNLSISIISSTKSSFNSGIELFGGGVCSS